MNIEVATPADLESRRSLARYTKYCTVLRMAHCVRENLLTTGTPGSICNTSRAPDRRAARSQVGLRCDTKVS